MPGARRSKIWMSREEAGGSASPIRWLYRRARPRQTAGCRHSGRAGRAEFWLGWFAPERRYSVFPPSFKREENRACCLTTPDVPGVRSGIAKRWDWCNRRTFTPASKRISLAHSIAATAAIPMSTTTCFSAATASVNGLNHVSFEVQDFDDLMLGHDLLHTKQYSACGAWGVSPWRASLRLLVRSMG